MSAYAVVQSQTVRKQRLLSAVPDRGALTDSVPLTSVRNKQHIKTRQRVRPDHPRTYGERHLSVVPEGMYVLRGSTSRDMPVYAVNDDKSALRRRKPFHGYMDPVSRAKAGLTLHKETTSASRGKMGSMSRGEMSLASRGELGSLSYAKTARSSGQARNLDRQLKGDRANLASYVANRMGGKNASTQKGIARPASAAVSTTQPMFTASMLATQPILTAPMRVVLGAGLVIGVLSSVFALGLYVSLGMGIVG
ncbi:MAG: hypothetical protein PUK59_01885 [Actinomycetaceae bacterium]|nr:hypothetical protein [Actinomycetaceae bacterium]MDY5853912.1 hypothetical protein [Arcanobacterium sp.]